MSRSLLLVFLLLVLIITSQFEWNQPLVIDDVDTTPGVSRKKQLISRREEAVKERIILSQEKNIQRLHVLVRRLKEELQHCRGKSDTTIGAVRASTAVHASTVNLIELQD